MKKTNKSSENRLPLSVKVIALICIIYSGIMMITALIRELTLSTMQQWGVPWWSSGLIFHSNFLDSIVTFSGIGRLVSQIIMIYSFDFIIWAFLIFVGYKLYKKANWARISIAAITIISTISIVLEKIMSIIQFPNESISSYLFGGYAGLPGIMGEFILIIIINLTIIYYLLFNKKLKDVFNK